MSSVMSKKAWEHSSHAPAQFLCMVEKLGAVTLLSPLTGAFSGWRRCGGRST